MPGVTANHSQNGDASVSKIASMFQSIGTSSSSQLDRQASHASVRLGYNNRSISQELPAPQPPLESTPVIDSKSKFCSAKALFENLEKKNNQRPPPFQQNMMAGSSPNLTTPKRHSSPTPNRNPKMTLANSPPSSGNSTPPGQLLEQTPVFSAIMSQSTIAECTSRSPVGRSTSTCVASPRTPPPPLPPKPKLATEQRSPRAQNLDQNDSSSFNSSPRDCSKEDSPLTEMTKQFNDLVNDLEKMTSESNSRLTSITSTPLPNSPSPIPSVSPSSASRYPRITQSLQMEKQNGKQPLSNQTSDTSIASNQGMSKPASLYEPYWRQHSWYTKRYGSVEGNGSLDSSAHDSDMTDHNNSNMSASVPSAHSTVTPPSTTYGLFRSKKLDNEQSQSDESKDSGLGPSSIEQPVRMRNGGPIGKSKDIQSSSRPSSDRTSVDAVEEINEDEASNRYSTSNGSLNGETRPLSSHVHIPQDVDGSKRWSTCSAESSSDVKSSVSAITPDTFSIPECLDFNVFPDGHFCMTVPGLPPDECLTPDPTLDSMPIKYAEKVQFSTAPMKVYSTHSVKEYDRRNEEIDPVSSSAEYELERRLEKMEVFDVELTKGSEGLGFSIIGMGVGADAGLEKLGIFVKSITSGGAVHKDGSIAVCDQIVEVDNQSLVGVSQAFAASVLRNTSGHVKFKIGRENNLDTSEIAMLIRQSLDQDRIRTQQTATVSVATNGYDSGHSYNSQEDSSTATATPTAASLDGEAEAGTVFGTLPSEDRTPEPLAESQPQIDDLMSRLRQQEDDGSSTDSDTSREGELIINELMDAPNLSMIDETTIIETPSPSTQERLFPITQQEEMYHPEIVSTATRDRVSPASKEVLSPETRDKFSPQAEGEASTSTEDGKVPTSNNVLSPSAKDEMSPIAKELVSPTTNEKLSPSTKDEESQTAQKGQAFHSEPREPTNSSPGLNSGLSGEMSLLLNESLQDSAARMRSLLNGSSADSSPASSRRSGVSSSLQHSLDEREIQSKIQHLQVDLDDTHHQAEKLRTLLDDSQQQCGDLEQKYVKAKRLLKEYQDREKDLLEREEAHLKQLQQKDQHYASLVHQLKDKIDILESQLRENQKKRTSIVEVQLSELQQQLKNTRRRNGSQQSDKDQVDCQTPLAVEPPKTVVQDISPALAYQPCASRTRQSQESEFKTTIRIVEDSPTESSTGIPETQLLDNTAAKSKVEAVKQSLVMCSRQLPTKRPETEVLIMCHHTEAHAAHINDSDDDEKVILDKIETKLDRPIITAPDQPIGDEPVNPNPAQSGRGSMSASPSTPRKFPHLRFPRILHPHKDIQVSRDGDVTQVLDVLHWSVDDVCKFLTGLGLDKYMPEFTVNKVDGTSFLQLDGSKLKSIGVQNHTDRALLKKRIKDLKNRIEKERKLMEKESRLAAKGQRQNSKRGR